MIRDYLHWVGNQEGWAFFGAFILTLVIIGIILIILAFIFSPVPVGEPYSFIAEVEDKSYSPERNSTGYGTEYMMINTEESFNMVFVTKDGQVITENDVNAYGRLEIGDRVRIWMQPRRLFWMKWSPQYLSAEKLNS